MSDPWARAATEFDEEQRQREQDYQAVAKAAEEWGAKWPAHCKCCGGWGGAVQRNYPHAPDDFDPCTGIPDGMCHRCGAYGLTDDSEGPCNKCGWNYDDGKPTY